MFKALAVLSLLLVLIAAGCRDAPAESVAQQAEPPAAPATTPEAPADDQSTGADQSVAAINVEQEQADCSYVRGFIFDAVGRARMMDTVMAEQHDEPTHKDLAADWQAIANRAPAEIQSQMQLMAGAYHQFAADLAELDLDDNPDSFINPANREKIDDIAKVLETDDFYAASAAVNRWARSTCGA